MSDGGIILSVDDNEAGLYARTRVLRRAGFNVHEAASGQAALDFIEREVPGLVLLDVNLPDISGIEICRLIKSNPRTERVPVVQISATAVSDADRDIAIHGGADVYLTEPTPSEELVSIVETLLRLKRTEHALNERLYRVGYVADSAPVLLWASDEDGNLAYANRPWLDIAGVQSVEELQACWLDRVHPEDREHMSLFQQQAVTARDGRSVEFRFKRVDGEYRWLLHQSNPLHFGDAGTGFAGSCVDISEQKRSEEEISRLLQVEQGLAARLQRVASTALLINSALDAESVLHLVTKAAADIIGAHQAIGMLSAFSPPMRALNLSPTYGAWRSSPAFPHHESIGRQVELSNKAIRLSCAELASRKHESIRSEEGLAMRGALAAPFIARNGNNVGWLQVSHKLDNTEFSAEDEATLVQLASIASVALENARLYGELRDADRRKDEFLATLAHELRNPLAPMRNALGIMQRAEGDAKLMQDAESTLDRQLKQMVRLIDDLLDISRITRDVVDLRKIHVPLVEVIRNAVETSTPLLEAKHQHLQLDLPPQEIYLDADPTRLAQVFANLLNNAAKYSPHGSVVSLTAKVNAAEVAVEIEDYGRGIAEEQIGHIFEMFTQVDHGSGGLGIGLTLVKRLVELHDGKVKAYSAGEGKGSRFCVCLPVVNIPGAEGLKTEKVHENITENADTAQPSGRSGGSGGRILVVDDNRDSAESLQVLLSLLGNEVSVAYDGQQAVEVAEAMRPHVVFLDIGLPVMNGYDAARAIRKKPWGSDVTLIALTGWGQQDDQQRAREAGFDRHFVKPVAFENLTEVLDELPIRKNAQRAL